MRRMTNIWGAELNGLAQKEWETLREFADAQHFKRMFRAYLRLSLTLRHIVDQHRRFPAEAKEQIIELIDRIRPQIPLKHALKVIGIGRSTYQLWLQQLKYKCMGSPTHLCVKRYPHQASPDEVKTMQSWLTSEALAHWPIYSIAMLALRRKAVLLAPSTWYRYAKLLGIQRQRPSHRRKKRKLGIRAERPDAIWHADVTILDTSTVRHYIYLVVDNFSRKVLSWKVSQKLRATIRVQTLEDAHQQFLSLGRSSNISLMVDGGPENTTIEGFINDSGMDIQKLVAQRDIQFSNSMVEAHNRILKYGYLYRQKINTERQLQKVMTEAVREFNSIRPHIALNGATPDEVYLSGTIPNDQHAKALAKAKKQRVVRNRKELCNRCIINTLLLMFLIRNAFF